MTMRCRIYNPLSKMKMRTTIGVLHLHLKLLNLNLREHHNLLLKGILIASYSKVNGSSSSNPRAPQRHAAPANRFASLSDFNNNENNDDDDEGRQNFFAGGEKSSTPFPIPQSR